MARPPSWLPRLHLIQRAVAQSVRSHYTRRDLEGLFQLQTSAASALMDLVPTIGLGSAQLVEREAMVEFLDRVQAAEDVPALMAELRAHKPPPSRRKVRFLVQKDAEPPTASSLPIGLTLERGRAEVCFNTLEQFAATLMQIAQWIDADPEGFARKYEPIPEPGTPSLAAEEARFIAAEVERLRRETLQQTVAVERTESDLSDLFAATELPAP